MSAFEDAVIQRIKQLEREVERLQKWERAADLGLGKLTDPNADRVLFWDESAGALKWLQVDGIVGTDLGKWQAYTPIWTAATTNPSIGNGTLAGRYTVIGKTCICSIKIVMGSTTSYGSGNWEFSIPLNAADNNAQTFIGFAHLRDTGVASYERFAQIIPSSYAGKINRFNDPTQGTNNSTINATVPFTWGNGDSIDIIIFYEIA